MSMGQREERLSTAELAAASERSTTSTMTADSAPVERRREDTSNTERQAPLFDSTDAEGLRGRWSDVQAGFVDEPRRAVEQADALVAEVMQRLAQAFAQERSTLEQQWDRGDDVNTEDLRQALRRY